MLGPDLACSRTCPEFHFDGIKSADFVRTISGRRSWGSFPKFEASAVSLTVPIWYAQKLERTVGIVLAISIWHTNKEPEVWPVQAKIQQTSHRLPEWHWRWWACGALTYWGCAFQMCILQKLSKWDRRYTLKWWFSPSVQSTLRFHVLLRQQPPISTSLMHSFINRYAVRRKWTVAAICSMPKKPMYASAAAATCPLGCVLPPPPHVFAATWKIYAECVCGTRTDNETSNNDAKEEITQFHLCGVWSRSVPCAFCTGEECESTSVLKERKIKGEEASLSFVCVERLRIRSGVHVSRNHCYIIQAIGWIKFFICKDE